MRSLGKLSLVLADGSRDYVGSLEKYIIKHHGSGFDVYSFTDPDRLRDFLKGCAAGVDIFLAGRDFIEAGLAKRSAKVFAFLDECGPAGGNAENDGIGRYQHAEKLMTAVMGRYSAARPERSLPSGRSSTFTACFFSPAGGAGCSTVAAGCSILCSRRGHKVFYLNLEDMPSTGLFFSDASEQNFSNMIYYLKSGEKNLNARLAGAKSIDAASGVHFFLPPERPSELSCLQASDLERLIGCIRSAAFYDAVFIDMPAALDERTAAVMNSSDKVVCVFRPDRSTYHKLGIFERELELSGGRQASGLGGKTIFVSNDAANSETAFYDCCGVKDDVIRLPYCETLRYGTDRIELMNCGGNFLSGIAGLLERLNPGWSAGRNTGDMDYGC